MILSRGINLVGEPERLGKYAILGVAGRGGMGTVYMGHDPVIDRKVAIKIYTTSEVEFGEVKIVDLGVAEHKHRRSEDSLPRLNPVTRTFSSSGFSVKLGEPLSMSNAIENATMRSLAAA